MKPVLSTRSGRKPTVSPANGRGNGSECRPVKALVLNRPGDIEIRDVPDPGEPGHGEVRVKVGAVGICGSDVHYFEHGRIGDFIVKDPMVLGHETAGVVESVGPGVADLEPGNRVAMEPGIPCGECRVCRAGRYNLCADVRFWATPPFDGSLAEYVVHPAEFSYRLPDLMTLEEGALMEPLAVGIHACNRAGVKPGDTVAVLGTGTIGCVTLLAARAYGAGTVIVADIVPERLERAKSLGATHVVDARSESLVEVVGEVTDGGGVDIGFDCSGDKNALSTLLDSVDGGGRVVMIGMGPQPVEVDLVTAMVKEADVLGIFRYANAYPKAIELVAGWSISVAPLVTDRYRFDDSVSAFEFAQKPNPGTCKIMIGLD